MGGFFKSIGSAIGLGGRDQEERTGSDLGAQSRELFEAGRQLRSPVIGLLKNVLSSKDIPEIFDQFVERGPTILSPAIQELASGENQAIQAIINRTPARGGQLNQQIAQTIRDRIFQQVLLGTRLREDERSDRLNLVNQLFGQAGNIAFGPGTTSIPLTGQANAGQLLGSARDRQIEIGRRQLQGFGALAGSGVNSGFRAFGK